MKNLKESILDVNNDFNLDKLLLINQFFNKARNKSPKEIDMFGKELYKGDLVIANYKGRPMVGMIMEVARGCCAICFSGDVSNTGDYRTPIGCYDVLKINDNIIKQLLK